MPSGGLVAYHNRNQCITSTLGLRKFTVNSTRASHGACEIAGELMLELVPLDNRVFVKRHEPCEWCLVQAEGKVEALSVIVATSIFDGEGVASEPLDWVLLRVVLSDPQRFEFLWEK
jgi:hypothetical protein